MNKKEATSAYIYPVLFGFLLVMMLVLYLFLPQHDFSQKENRYLQMRPALTLQGLKDGSFMDRFETYTTEQLPFRDFLVECKAFLNGLTLSRENDEIVRGGDGYLFEKCYGYSAQLSKNETAILKFVQDADRPVVVAIAPNASEILKDHVPAGCPQVDQTEALNDLYEKIEALPCGNSVDLVYPLKDAAKKQPDKQLYYRTDHHWTTDASYLAYVEIVGMLDAVALSKPDAMDEDLFETTDPTSSILHILPAPVANDALTKHEANDFYGTMAAKFKGCDLRPDTLTWYDVAVDDFARSDGNYDSLYDLSKLNIYDKYAMFLRGNDEICTISARNAGNGRHLIVFKDSYANCLLPFLTYQYDEITVVDLRYYNESVAELLAGDPGADLLLLYNFSFLNEDNHFYRLTS
ncbi:MAG: hypothetical protein K6E16_09460 [Lachnospiraceae bacterium]|nr:hypothetical protein [Lachnospiraceae bacterium]